MSVHDCFYDCFGVLPAGWIVNDSSKIPEMLLKQKKKTKVNSKCCDMIKQIPIIKVYSGVKRW